MPLTHALHYRILKRCTEVANEPDAPSAVKIVYAQVLKEPLEKYVAAADALVRAESSWSKENGEAVDAIAAFHEAFNTARNVVAAILPSAVLPESLTSMTTDTDRVTTIERLLHLIEEHGSEGWAAELLSGEFGTKAPKIVHEIEEAIASSKALTSAKDARAEAYGLSYEKCLAFKRVVRAAYGPSSRQYQRINARTRSDNEPSPTPTP